MPPRFRVPVGGELLISARIQGILDSVEFLDRTGSFLEQKGGLKKEAEACYLKALDVARRQEAKSHELRTAVSLGRLWHSQGKKDEARELLSSTYNWFTEGFETVDLREAKALLEELS